MTEHSRLRVAHLVVTDNFAGVERYVSQTANELVHRAHEVSVVGGSPEIMRNVLTTQVAWQPGGRPRQALSSLRRLPPQQILHVHMTAAEAVGVLWSRGSGASVVATRHFARPRGSGVPGRAFSRLFNRLAASQLAIGEYVASHVEVRPDAVVPLGTPVNDAPYASASRVALIVQRLEREKHTQVGLEAWHASGLGDRGWTLRIVGEGSQRSRLEQWATAHGLRESVRFVGWSSDVHSHLVAASMLLATAPAEPFGLTVLEAMAAGVPVIAADGGGHRETIGAVAPSCLFPPGDAAVAADVLCRLADDPDLRLELSGAVRTHQARHLTVRHHVDQLETVYSRLLTGRAS